MNRRRKGMKLDQALKLYIALYCFCFLLTWLISVPMLIHVTPQSECLLFVTPYVKYGSPASKLLVVCFSTFQLYIFNADLNENLNFLCLILVSFLHCPMVRGCFSIIIHDNSLLMYSCFRFKVIKLIFVIKSFLLLSVTLYSY
jgi:hypothetical protein